MVPVRSRSWRRRRLDRPHAASSPMRWPPPSRGSASTTSRTAATAAPSRPASTNARGELICFSDGDLQFDLREMSRLLERLADAREAGRRGDRLPDQAPRPVPPHLHRQDLQRHRVGRLRPAGAGHRLRHEAVPARGVRRAARSMPRGRSCRPSCSSSCARAACASAQVGVNHYPARGGHEHGGQLQEDPAHLPGPGEAALGPVDEARRGARPPRRAPRCGG